MNTTVAAPAAEPTGWRLVMRNLRQRKVLAMLLLGFSSGIPIYLVGNTLSLWMRKEGIELSTIGFVSWVGLAYSLKFLWAPLVDKADAPVLGRLLGRRRGWMVLSQLAVMGGLVAMATIQPGGANPEVFGFAIDHLAVFGAMALLVALASATQDIVIDAWRIESADNSQQLGLLTSSSALGYRTALLVTDALLLIVAAQIGWPMSYTLMAALMLVGTAAVLMAPEPARAQVAVATQAAPVWSARGLFDAIVNPFVQFFRTHRSNALLMLAAISIYRLADFVMGPMANPFYVDLGISEATVGSIRGSVGLVATFIGIAAAGIVSVRYGVMAALLVGAVLGPGSNLAFAWLAFSGNDIGAFTTAMFIDNVSGGFAGTALIAYMSRLPCIRYPPPQCAMLSSCPALRG